jgi:hypothetical protein
MSDWPRGADGKLVVHGAQALHELLANQAYVMELSCKSKCDAKANMTLGQAASSCQAAHIASSPSRRQARQDCFIQLEAALNSTGATTQDMQSTSTQVWARQ